MTSTTKLEQLLDELVRPALRAHGGDAELVSFQHPPPADAGSVRRLPRRHHDQRNPH